MHLVYQFSPETFLLVFLIFCVVNLRYVFADNKIKDKTEQEGMQSPVSAGHACPHR